MWIFYIDKQQYWKCVWITNICVNAHSKWTVSTNPSDTYDNLELPETSERSWASFQVTPHTQFCVGWLEIEVVVDCFTVRLFHSVTILAAACICCLKLYMTLLRWRVFGVGWGGGLPWFGCGWGHSASAPVHLLFGDVYWTRQSRVFRHLKSLLLRYLIGTIGVVNDIGKSNLQIFLKFCSSVCVQKSIFNIGAWTKLSTFCNYYFRRHFLLTKFRYLYSDMTNWYSFCESNWQLVRIGSGQCLFKMNLCFSWFQRAIADNQR